ncbi:MAG: SUKH-4 family immunity protein [Isosphaeraceae bacterium]
MLHLNDHHRHTIEGLLPTATLAFLSDHGVPEILEFRGIDHVFSLGMEPLLGGRVLRVGSVDDGWSSMGVERTTGHFGYILAESEQPPWCFVNSSLACFLACFEAAERLLARERAEQIAWDDRGPWLEREIRRIDPVVFDDENNIWSFLVEELKNGVV